MPIKAMDLFDAYSQDKLPKAQAYVVSSFIKSNSGYCLYEVVSYTAVKNIIPEADGLTFQSSGKKMHILIEPPSYPHKATEPYLREKNEQIPLRFNELELLITRNQAKVFIAKMPIESLTSFTVAKPHGLDISFLFFDMPDVYDTMIKFFEQSLNHDARVPQADARKAAKMIIEVVEKQMAFKSDFGH